MSWVILASHKEYLSSGEDLEGIKLVLCFAIQPEANRLAILGLNFSHLANGSSTYASGEPQRSPDVV